MYHCNINVIVLADPVNLLSLPAAKPGLYCCPRVAWWNPALVCRLKDLYRFTKDGMKNKVFHNPTSINFQCVDPRIPVLVAWVCLGYYSVTTMSSVDPNTDRNLTHQHPLNPVAIDHGNVVSPDLTMTKESALSHHPNIASDKTNSAEVKSAFVKEDPGMEKGVLTASSLDSDVPVSGSMNKFSRYFSKWKIFMQIFIWLLFTGYVFLRR